MAYAEVCLIYISMADPEEPVEKKARRSWIHTSAIREHFRRVVARNDGYCPNCKSLLLQFKDRTILRHADGLCVPKPADFEPVLQQEHCLTTSGTLGELDDDDDIELIEDETDEYWDDDGSDMNSVDDGDDVDHLVWEQLFEDT